jgi:hypothetical protein
LIFFVASGLHISKKSLHKLTKIGIYGTIRFSFL